MCVYISFNGTKYTRRFPRNLHIITDLFGDCLGFPSVNMVLLFNKKQRKAKIITKTKQISMWNPQTSLVVMPLLQSQMLRSKFPSSVSSGSRIKSSVVASSSNQMVVDFDLYPGIEAITAAKCLSSYQNYILEPDSDS